MPKTKRKRKGDEGRRGKKRRKGSKKSSRKKKVNKDVDRVIEGTIIKLNKEGEWSEGVVNAAYGSGKFLIELEGDSDDGDSYDLNDMEFEILEGAEEPTENEDEEEMGDEVEDEKPKKKRRNKYADEEFIVDDEKDASEEESDFADDGRELEEIITSKGKGRNRRYLCQWKGVKNPTWEDRDEMKLLGLKNKIKEFDGEKKAKKTSKQPEVKRKLRSGRNVKKVNYNEKALQDANEEESSSEEEESEEEESENEEESNEESEKSQEEGSDKEDEVEEESEEISDEE